MIAKALDGMCTDYGKMPHELMNMTPAEVSFAVAVRMKARQE